MSADTDADAGTLGYPIEVLAAVKRAEDARRRKPTIVFGFEWENRVLLMRAPVLPIRMHFEDTDMAGLRVLVGGLTFHTELCTIEATGEPDAPSETTT